jgi:hypothetical protein
MVQSLRRSAPAAAALLLLGLVSSSCGEVARQGQSPAFLIVNTLDAASGAAPGTFGGTLASDVLTVVNNIPTRFNDVGRVEFALGLKDPGPATGPTTPSQNNFITVTQYHVRYLRSDGRNTEGVDVPFAFDGAVTATISDTAQIAFTIVRVQAKEEAPLRALTTSGGIISAIAEVTFYGHDQTGREVSAVGRISVDFANFADPS